VRLASRRIPARQHPSRSSPLRRVELPLRVIASDGHKAVALCFARSVWPRPSAQPPSASPPRILGVDDETLAGLNLGVTTHTAVGTYNDTSDTVTDIIAAWTLSGFYQPVDMNGVYNRVKGGSTVPLKFEVFAGATELTSTSAVASFVQRQITCDGTALLDDVEVTTTGGTSLRYDTTAGQFIQNWKTPTGAGACYRVTMTTQDGSSLVAYFKLR
jgi:hypothetical protein